MSSTTEAPPPVEAPSSEPPPPLEAPSAQPPPPAPAPTESAQQEVVPPGPTGEPQLPPGQLDQPQPRLATNSIAVSSALPATPPLGSQPQANDPFTTLWLTMCYQAPFEWQGDAAIIAFMRSFYDAAIVPAPPAPPAAQEEPAPSDAAPPEPKPFSPAFVPGPPTEPTVTGEPPQPVAPLEITPLGPPDATGSPYATHQPASGPSAADQSAADQAPPDQAVAPAPEQPANP
jgi:hypothetical protein